MNEVTFLLLSLIGGLIAIFLLFSVLSIINSVRLILIRKRNAMPIDARPRPESIYKGNPKEIISDDT